MRGKMIFIGGALLGLLAAFQNCGMKSMSGGGQNDAGTQSSASSSTGVGFKTQSIAFGGVLGTITSVNGPEIYGWACVVGDPSASIMLDLYVGASRANRGAYIFNNPFYYATNSQDPACGTGYTMAGFYFRVTDDQVNEYGGQAIFIEARSSTGASATLDGSGAFNLPQGNAQAAIDQQTAAMLRSQQQLRDAAERQRQANLQPMRLINQLSYSSAGALPNKTCVQLIETSDPHTWDDNFLCSDVDLGIRWSSAGPIEGMSCTQINEPSDADTWDDNFLCTPVDQHLAWSFAGPIPGRECIQIHEAADPDTWNDNYLCQ